MRNDKSWGPWTELGQVLATRPKRVGSHPPESVLLAYLKGELSSNPPEWTQGRLRAFLRGKLREWTQTDVRMHLASCARCRTKVLQWQTAPSPQPSTQWKKRLANPRLAWVLAGTQAVALAGLIIWLIISPSPASISKPDFLLPSHAAQTEWVNARLVPNPDVTVAQLNTVLQAYGIVIVNGPDEEGAYVVAGKDKALEEVAATQVVESITIEGR